MLYSFLFSRRESTHLFVQQTFSACYVLDIALGSNDAERCQATEAFSREPRRARGRRVIEHGHRRARSQGTEKEKATPDGDVIVRRDAGLRGWPGKAPP